MSAARLTPVAVAAASIFMQAFCARKRKGAHSRVKRIQPNPTSDTGLKRASGRQRDLNCMHDGEAMTAPLSTTNLDGGEIRPARESSTQGRHSQDQARYREVFERAAVGMALRSLDARWLQVNRKLCEMLGYTREELLATSSLLLTPAEERGRAEEYNRRIARGEIDTYQREKRYLRRDGSTLWVELNLTVMRDREGRPDHVLSVIVDISARKAAEDALKAGEARFRSLVGLSNDVFWETDREHRFVRQEHSGLPSSRPPPANELGKTRWEMPYTRPDEEGWRRHREDLDEHRVFRDFVVARPVEGGGERFIQVSGEPLFDAAGRFTGYRGVGKDVTDRVAAESALRALNADLEHRVAERTVALETAYRELEAFSYSVSHDLRAPLRAIAGFATILREDEGDVLSGEGNRLLGIIDQSAQQMGHLTDALLALARTSRQKLAHGPLDMQTLANEVAGDFATAYPAARIDVGAIPPAFGDVTLMRQVFVNLIGNALKYSSRATAPVVHVGVEKQATGMAYFVRDNGIGFDMAYVERLFRPFERLHAEREFRGAGIGLALANLIIQRHGGRIWAEGRPGQGAVFRFTLGG
jgi:PAS domain S-box-containing protein